MDDRAAASAGFVAAGVALAVALFAWPGGRLPGGVPATVALLGFAARRYGFLDRRVGAGIAGLGGLGLLAVAPIAVRDGAAEAGALVVAVAGGVVLAAAYAEYRGVSQDRLEDKTAAAVTAGVVGAFGLLAILAWFIVLSGVLGVAGALSDTTRIALSSVAGGLGTASVTLLYVQSTDRGLDFLDVAWPTRRDLGDVAVGVIGIMGLNLLIGAVFDRLGVESAQHGILRVAQDDPGILLILIPLAFVFIGPGEELLYRNVVQKTLYDEFSRSAAVVVASVVFGVVHVFSFSGGGTAMATANSLAIVFALSLVLGVVYERTGSVVAAAVVHALHDAIGFAATYAELVGWFDPPTALALLAHASAAVA